MQNTTQKLIALLIGIIFIGVGVFMYFKNDELQKVCTEEATATVIDMKEEINTDTDSITDYLYYPILEFNDGNKDVQVKSPTGSSSPAYNINDKIEILYNPNNSKEFIIKGDKSSNIFSIVFACLGLIISGYSIFTFIKKN